MEGMTKICTKCGTEKKATSDFFAKDRKGKYGLKATCKDCDRTYRKKHYKENHEAIRKKQNVYLKKYYMENKKKILDYKKQYYANQKASSICSQN